MLELRKWPNQVHGSKFWKNNNRNCSGIMTQISIRYKSRTDAVISNEKSMIGKHLSGTALYNMYLFCGSASVHLLFR